MSLINFILCYAISCNNLPSARNNAPYVRTNFLSACNIFPSAHINHPSDRNNHPSDCNNHPSACNKLQSARNNFRLLAIITSPLARITRLIAIIIIIRLPKKAVYVLSIMVNIAD